MKKTLLVLFTCSTAFLFGQTQLPNSSFENWEDESFLDIVDYEEPIPWNVGNVCAGFGSQGSCAFATIKTTNANTGSFAAEIRDDGAVGLNLTDHDFTDRPLVVEFYADVDLAAGAEAEVTIYFHNGSIFGSASYLGGDTITITESTTGYQKFSSTLSYQNQDAYEHVTVIASVTDANNTSRMYFDDISFSYDVLSISNTIDANAITMAPNPSSNRVRFSESLRSVKIRNVAGEIVKEAQNTESMQIADLPAGIYLVTMLTANEARISKRLVVE